MKKYAFTETMLEIIQMVVELNRQREPSNIHVLIGHNRWEILKKDYAYMRQGHVLNTSLAAMLFGVSEVTIIKDSIKDFDPTEIRVVGYLPAKIQPVKLDICFSAEIV